MPEEIIDLNSIVSGRQPINSSETPKEVTFDRVHSILYGNSSTKLIYDNAQKYFTKKFDQTYPHTSLQRDLFISIIQKVHPSLKVQFVVEIGSFTGNSASIMGKVLKESYPGSFLLCIDTWLGDLAMWINKAVWEHLSVSEDGRPTVYYQFLTNIIKQNLTTMVLPASMTSIIGARFLQTYRFYPQVIYLDSAHEQGETLIELSLYWNLLRPGGILFGDDWGWSSVRCDLKKFSYMKNLTIEQAGNTWILKKPVN
ncbi:unnamed protein product [Adineta steineri]|uniref:Class I SAM-dependent methyltransferase n=2 Tax=Adineta steineri TaxID=433720 RepID=A0A813SYJ3_9BILA|nr:unnamed protein product [Adineta steineri]CAF0805438.1 unnamed protein product [Adineta steineri]CAF0812989.1 unnamed protein product [Adineta steineri]